MDVREGLEKSIEFLKPLVMGAPPKKGTGWWELAGFHQITEDNVDWP